MAVNEQLKERGEGTQRVIEMLNEQRERERGSERKRTLSDANVTYRLLTKGAWAQERVEKRG